MLVLRTYSSCGVTELFPTIYRYQFSVVYMPWDTGAQSKCVIIREDSVPMVSIVAKRLNCQLMNESSDGCFLRKVVTYTCIVPSVSKSYVME